MSSSRPRRNAASKAMDAIADDVPRMSRPRRSASGTDAALATVSRDPPSSPSSQQSLRLTVKLSSSKLRQATGGPNPRGGHSSSARDPFAGGEIIQGKRARNVKKTYVVESESDEEDEDEEMEDIADDDDIEGDSADDDDEDEDEDAEGEEDADGDIDMDIPPPPPIIKVSRAANAKAVISAKPAAKSDGKIIEQKEVSDDELSELDSDIEESMQIGGDEDAEGEDEEIEVEEDDEDDLDSDDETPADGSRASTPDLTKLTKRQRARLEEGGSGHLLALPDG
jgi:Ino eighty subunit 2